MTCKGSGPNPGVENNMSKKVLLIAGVVLAAGSVAAVSSPYFRGAQLRLGRDVRGVRRRRFRAPSRPVREAPPADGRRRRWPCRQGGVRQVAPRALRRRDLEDDAEDMPSRAQRSDVGRRARGSRTVAEAEPKARPAARAARMPRGRASRGARVRPRRSAVRPSRPQRRRVHRRQGVRDMGSRARRAGRAALPRSASMPTATAR